LTGISRKQGVQEKWACLHSTFELNALFYVPHQIILVHHEDSQLHLQTQLPWICLDLVRAGIFLSPYVSISGLKALAWVR